MAVIRNKREEASEQTTIRVSMKICKSPNGNQFIAYKFNNNGKWADLRFRMTANIKELEALAFEGVTSAEITVVGLSDASAKFVYPRFYASDIVGDIIVNQ